MVGVVGLALGGEAGTRLIDQLGMPTSPSTVLRMVRRLATVPSPVVRVIGVDDFAFRRGRTYGTVIVDLETHRPIDLLPDRTAETLTSWLEQHPALTTVARDRSTEYARGVAAGAPHATQVLDRWHIHKNVSEMVERLVQRHQHALGTLVIPADAPGRGAFPDHPPPRTQTEQAARRGRRHRRHARYRAIQDLYAHGMSQREIGRRLGLSRETVRLNVEADAAPERRLNRPKPSILDPFEAYLQHRWMNGCHNGVQLWREICEQGYPGSRKRVTQWVQQRRTEPALTTPRPYRAAVMQRMREQPLPRIASVRRLTWMLLREPDSLIPAERAALSSMRTTCPAIDHAYPLVHAFLALLRGQRPDELDAWFDAAMASDVTDLRTFAAGLYTDKEALRQALILPWSNGPTEGIVNKIKLVKRQMYGRASFALLRQRVLLTGGACFCAPTMMESQIMGAGQLAIRIVWQSAATPTTPICPSAEKAEGHLFPLFSAVSR